MRVEIESSCSRIDKNILMNYSRTVEKWVWRNMPIIVQCNTDIDEGYGLVALFYHYYPEENVMEFHYVFKVSLVTWM